MVQTSPTPLCGTLDTLSLSSPSLPEPPGLHSMPRSQAGGQMVGEGHSQRRGSHRTLDRAHPFVDLVSCNHCPSPPFLLLSCRLWPGCPERFLRATQKAAVCGRKARADFGAETGGDRCVCQSDGPDSPRRTQQVNASRSAVAEKGWCCSARPTTSPHAGGGAP